MKEKCNDEFGCEYSKTMDQPYPRLCMNCGHPEPISAIDSEKEKIHNIGFTSLDVAARVLQIL